MYYGLKVSEMSGIMFRNHRLALEIALRGAQCRRYSLPAYSQKLPSDHPHNPPRLEELSDFLPAHLDPRPHMRLTANDPVLMHIDVTNETRVPDPEKFHSHSDQFSNSTSSSDGDSGQDKSKENLRLVFLKLSEEVCYNL